MKCWHCKAEFTREHALRVAENRFTLSWQDWDGWRFSGRYLIAPGKAGRILPARLLGLLWEEQQRSRVAKTERRGSTRSRIVSFPQRLPASERFDGLA